MKPTFSYSLSKGSMAVIAATLCFWFTLSMSALRAQNTNAAQLMNASTQYFSSPDSTSLSITGDLTIECWVQLNSAPVADGQYMSLVSKFEEAGHQSFWLQYYNNGGPNQNTGLLYQIRFGVTSSGTGIGLTELESDQKLNIGQWNHIAVTYNAASTTGKLYINGVLVQTKTNMESSIFDSDARVMIGASRGTPANFLNGLIDEVRIWSVTRTQAQIQSSMLSQLAGTTANLNGYWKLNNALVDDSGNGNTLTNVHGAIFTNSDLPFTGHPVISGQITGTNLPLADNILISLQSVQSSFQLAIPAPGSFQTGTITPSGSYLVTAFMDGNGNGVQESWEYTGAYADNPLSVASADIANVDITLNSPLQQMSSTPSTSGLQGYWSFDNGTAVDQSGGGHNGTLLGNTLATDAWSGKGLCYDGISSSVDNGVFPSTELLTVSAYILVDSQMVASPPTSSSIVDHSNNFVLRLKNVGGSLKFEGSFNGWGGMRIDIPPVQSTTTVTGNKFYHVAMTCDGWDFKLYVNGVKEAQTRVTYNECCGANIGNPVLYFGSQGNSSQRFKGIIDEVRIYNRILSASEVAQLAVSPTLPSIAQAPQDQTSPVGTAAVLHVTAAGTQPYTFQWLKNDSPIFNSSTITGADASTLTLPNVQPQDAGAYSVTVKNICGSVTSTQALLKISGVDMDHDGIPDAWEQAYGLNPNLSSDANTHPSGDQLTYVQKYSFGLNPIVTDTDGDGVSDYDELFTYGSNPFLRDTSGGGIPDGWKIAHGLDPRVNNASGDADLDGLTNSEEYQAGTDPKAAFTNGNTVADYDRVRGAQIRKAFFDNNDRLIGENYTNGTALAYVYDGNSNLVRQVLHTQVDADHDGLPDVWELAYGLNPNSAAGDDGSNGDPDHDSWTNYQEFQASTNPHDASSHPNPQTTPASQLRETPTMAQLFPSSNTQAGLPVLNTKLWDGEGNAAKMYAQYYDTATQQWKNATLNNLDGSVYTGTSTATALPGGSAHTLVWNAYQDLGSAFNGSALLRVRADDAFSTGAWSQPTSYNVNMNGTNNALLASLGLSGVTLSPSFSPGTTSYTGTVPFATASTTVTTAALGSGTSVAGTGSQTLAIGDNTLNVTVTAADGVTQQLYTVVVHRRSNDASLAALSLSGTTLSPPFASGTTNYLATVHTTTSSTTVSATATNATAVVTGTGVKALAPGGNAIALTVTAEDGNSQTYTVNVTRAAAMDGDLDLTLATNADGNVNAIALQPDGKMLAGGAFNTFGGQPRSHLARLNADGSLDTACNPSLDGTMVHAISMQADGKILVGGDFTTCAGQTRNRLARLNADASLDANFNPNADGEVFAVMLQADGKMLVGGAFTNIGGLVRSKIARLNADGTADANFNPGTDDVALALAVQPDGKILVGGKFTQLGGAARNHIARINADGTLDATFNPGANSDVNTITVQPDGKLLVGGTFTTLAGTARSSIGRLNADGTLDATFNPAASAVVDAFALTADGKILLAGDFTALGSISRVRLARLNADGTVDGSFNQDADARVSALALQTDGAVWIGGGFNNVSGTARARIARLTNGPATQTVTANATGRTLLWSRSGSSADVGHATFEKSMDGTTWTLLGSGSRVGTTSAWNLIGLALPVSQPFFIRARGQPMQAGGSSGGGQSLYEGSASITLTPVPEITVEQPAGTGLVDGAASVDFGANPAATQVERSFTLRNTGTADLTGIVASITTGGGDFSITATPASILTAGSSTTLKVTLTTSASAAGTRAGHLSIASSDTERNPFDVNLTGLTQAPQMVVEQPAGTSLADGSSSVAFSSALTGSSVSKTFTIKNTGNANLTGLGITIDGTNATDFSVTSAPTAPVTGPSGSTTFILRFTPAASGAKSAVLHIANNDTSTAGSYDIALTGRAFVAAADDDGDGISNATELNLAAFGFDAMSNDSTRLTQLRTNGLYQASDMQTLALGSPVLTRDATTGHFHINVNLQRSLNLTTWTPLTGFTPTLVAPTGTLDIDIPPDGTSPQFFRVIGNKP